MPMVTTIFIAASTDMSVWRTCEAGTYTIRPEVGFGVVGTYTHTCFSPVTRSMSSRGEIASNAGRFWHDTVQKANAHAYL